MLTLTGKIRAVTQLGGGVNRKTGEVIPLRDVVQVESEDHRGLFVVHTLTVPDPAPFRGRIGEEIKVPVRAWATSAVVNLSYEAPK
jgi:hypothetical protein